MLPHHRKSESRDPSGFGWRSLDCATARLALVLTVLALITLALHTYFN
jgi:hypothetical protein